MIRLGEIVSEPMISFVIIFVFPLFIVGMGLYLWKKKGYSVYPIDISLYGNNVQVLSDPIAFIEQTVPPLEHRIEKNPIRILTGEASCASLCNKEIVNWIEKAHRMGNRIEMIAGPNIDPKTIPLLKKWIIEEIIEFRYSKKRAHRHFRIFGDHIYLEMPHRPNAKRRTGLNISGANSELRNKLTKEFDGLWSNESNETIRIQTPTEMETLIKRNTH